MIQDTKWNFLLITLRKNFFESSLPSCSVEIDYAPMFLAQLKWHQDETGMGNERKQRQWRGVVSITFLFAGEARERCELDCCSFPWVKGTATFSSGLFLFFFFFDPSAFFPLLSTSVLPPLTPPSAYLPPSQKYSEFLFFFF